MRIDIGLEIENSHTGIVGLENDVLVIALNLPQNAPHTNKTLNPYTIYNTLENKGKNTYNNTKIIEKIETPDFIEYRFNYGLILNIFVDKENKVILEHTKKEMAFINSIYFSYDIIGDSNAIPQDELSELIKDYGYERKAYKSIFKKEVCINYGCLERVIFSHCEFEDKLSLYRLKDSNEAIEFHNGMNFENCIFNGEVEFRNLVSGTPLPNHKYHNNERETNFKNCIFKKRVDFSNAKFCNDVYFNNSHFYDSADFHECEFEKTACFYGVTFHNKTILNFSQAIFKENLNFVNVKCDFEFEKLDERIKQEKEQDSKKNLDKFANDFRDSFRIIKNALIKDNNLLDASNFHKYELYCKEIELKSKDSKTLQDKIDKLQLCFYRKLCNHHTDLILNLKWLVITIGLFTILFFASKIIQGKEILNLNHFLNLNHYGIALTASSCIIIVLLYLFDYLKLLGGFACLNLVATLWLVCYNPKLIFGVVNILGNSCFNSFENIVMVTYTIMMFLVVFSLQKTARKNSIVPS